MTRGDRQLGAVLEEYVEHHNGTDPTEASNRLHPSQQLELSHRPAR
jgi:hypothetical protein